MSAEDGGGESQPGVSQTRSPKKMTVQPTQSGNEKGRSEDIEMSKVDSSERAVLKLEEEPGVVAAGTKKETAPKKKKWWKKGGGEDKEKKKAIPIHKLFRYATWYDLILIFVSLFFAIVHGCALPGAFYVFGDTINLFANFDISQQVFDGFPDLVASQYNNFTFNDNANISSLMEAVGTRTISPGVIQTRDNITSLRLMFTNVTQMATSFEEADSVSCVVLVYAMQMNITVYESLRSLAQGTGLTTEPSDAGCECIEPLFQQHNAEARCLTEDDFLYGEGGVDGILWQLYLFLIIAGVVFVAAYFQISFMQTACERQVQKMRLLYYQCVLRQEIGWFDLNPSGEVSSRLNDDLNKVHDGIGDKLAILVQWIATFFAGFAIAFARDWRLTLFLLLVVPILIAMASIFSKFIAAFSRGEQKLYAAAGAIAEEVLQAVRTVIAFGGEHREAERYKTRLADARRVGVQKGVTGGFNLALIYFAIFVSYGVAFWFGGFLIQMELTQPGDMLTAFFSVVVGAFSLGQATPNMESILTALGAAAEVFETIDRVPPIDSSSDEGLIPDKLNPTIKFQDVCFSYPARPDVQVMQGLDLEVKVGQTVALVGPSGCGKSTVVQLLQRFYNPSAGQILLDGNDIASLNLKWLRSNIGVVSQEPVLFDTTIAENIRYGKEDATMEEIEDAAKAANAYDFISELPNGFNTNVGERGTQLSGGQKQRIAIARALVRDPKILLLDEATSALDNESEKIVQQALDKAREGRTTIVIAHRLSTIQTADVIAGIEGGRVVEMGTHAELMDKGGLYYELVTAQSHVDIDEADELVVSPLKIKKGSSIRRLRSQRSRQASESEEEGLERKGGSIIIKRQLSTKVSKRTGIEAEEVELTEKDLEKLQEEWDKDIPEVKLTRVMKANAKEWWLIMFGLLGSLVLGGIFPSFAIIFGEILEVFNRPVDRILDALHPYAALFIVLGVVSGIAVFFKSVSFSIAGEKLTARLRAWSFKAILRQEVGWFDSERNSSGILATRLAQDASLVQGATGTRLGTLAETFVGMILALVIAFVYAWLLTLVLLSLVPFMIVSGFLQLKALTGHAGKNKKALEQAGKIAVDSMENIRTVASLGIEPKFFALYSESVKRPYKRSLLNTIVYGLTYGFSQGIVFFGFVLTFGFGAFQVVQDRESVVYEEYSHILVALMAVIFGAQGVGQASSFAPNYAKAKQSANRIYALLDREPVIDGYSEDGLKPDEYKSQIEVEKIEFTYPNRPEVQVLQGLSLSLQPGKTLALVGSSGCGKSTIVSLLERFYDVQSGSLKVDSNDLRDLNIRWLRRQIGIVSQEPVLFDRSIADNIRYGANFREVSDEEIVEAAKAANIHNFIQSLPEGYSTNVGSKGTQLSGGQKQRIAIARALVRDPKILLLDEATSALDTESEKIVQEALDKAREGRTTIVIAHRLSTIYNSDCIAVISKGRVVEQGTHSELMGAKGIYYKLNLHQLRAEKEEEEEREKRSASVQSPPPPYSLEEEATIEI